MLVTGFQLLQFLECFQIDVTDVVDFSAEIVNLLLHRLPFMLFLITRRMFQLGQLDSVVFAKPIGQRVALMAYVSSKQFLGMDLLNKMEIKDMSSSRKGAYLYRFDQKKYKKLVEGGYNFTV